MSNRIWNYKHREDLCFISDIKFILKDWKEEREDLFRLLEMEHRITIADDVMLFNKHNFRDCEICKYIESFKATLKTCKDCGETYCNCSKN